MAAGLHTGQAAGDCSKLPLIAGRGGDSGRGLVRGRYLQRAFSRRAAAGHSDAVRFGAGHHGRPGQGRDTKAQGRAAADVHRIAVAVLQGEVDYPIFPYVELKIVFRAHMCSDVLELRALSDTFEPRPLSV